MVRNMKCIHIFHTACLDEWYARGHNQCPLCKGEICPPDPVHFKNAKADMN
jgi:E3 ubiquitin-protein ligase RHA2